MLQELSEQGIAELAEIHSEPYAIFFFTPLCGTCKVTLRMLEIIESMHSNIRLYSANVNYMPRLVSEWRIASVPCIIILDQQKVVDIIYASRSVQYLSEKLKNVL